VSGEGSATEARATSMRDALCGRLSVADVGRAVRLCGWVAHRREHGEHLAFVDLRDFSGIVQCVLDGSVDVRSEYVIQVAGTVRHRPEGTVNPRLSTGEVELQDCTVEVLAEAQPPPFPVEDDTDADELVRMRHRFVDLRRPKMQANLRLRATVNSALRRSMERQGFCEVETPLLWAPTPEGAREFAVPSRIQRGSFYVLPQSPQLAKQLLMVGGVDRYYQIAHCMRDEDVRADRQFEFTQFDLEASFVTRDDVLSFMTDAMAEVTEAVRGERPGPFDEITWFDALDRYGTDKPDLRFGMELKELTPVFAATGVRALARACVKALVVPGGAGLARSRLDALVERAGALGAKGLAWFKVASAEGAPALESPLARHLTADEASGLLAATGAGPGDLVLVVADDDHPLACRVLGALRVELGAQPVGEGPLHYVWVVDFPLFEGLDDAGAPIPAHHPFTMPHPDDVGKLLSDPLAVRSQSYDLVLNGWELGSGSIRIHRADVQQAVFRSLGIDEETAATRFGFLLSAFRFGAPPHGGFAIGIDRLVAILAREENIREVIAFPKTQSGSDPLTGAPKALAAKSLAELGIRIVDP
jgi:aspartyl-tRNA synthetase